MPIQPYGSMVYFGEKKPRMSFFSFLEWKNQSYNIN